MCKGGAPLKQFQNNSLIAQAEPASANPRIQMRPPCANLGSGLRFLTLTRS